MKKYIRTIYPSTPQRPSDRISISYYSLTRHKSPKIYRKVYLRVGGLVVSIANLQGNRLLPTYRTILIALCLSPLCTQRPNRFVQKLGLANTLHMKSFYKKVNLLRKLSTSELTELTMSQMANLSSTLPDGRISLDYSPDLYRTALLFLMNLESFIQVYQKYFDALESENPLKQKLLQMYPNLFSPM